MSSTSRERDIHTSIAEADNIGVLVPVDVGKQARIRRITTPTASTSRSAEGAKTEKRRREPSVTGGESNPNSSTAESDDIGARVTVDVSKLARIGRITAPAPSATGGTEGSERE